MEMERWVSSSWKLPALSGLLLVLAYYTPLLAPNFVLFVPLLLWLDRRPDAGRYARLKAGFVFGFLTYMIGLHFVLYLLRFSWLAGLLYVWLAATFGLRIGLCVILLGWLRRRTSLSWGLLLPICWLPIEWLQGFGDLRMTHDHMAHSLSRFPFVVQFADLVGHYGVGAFLLAVNGLLFEALLTRGRPTARRAALALAVLVGLVGVYDLWAWFRPLPPGETLRVALVQPNISLTIKPEPETRQSQLQTLVDLSRRAAAEQPDLIVWPETARPRPLYHWLDKPESYVMPDVQRLSRELGVPFLIGAEYVRVRTKDDYDLYNATMLVDADGVSEDWSAKVYLVAFAEALPFRPLLGRFIEGRGGEWSWISGGFSPGVPGSLLRVGETEVGALVCYEQMYPTLSRELRNAGANFQVVMTNDAWFGPTMFQRYQADAVRLRAIENRSDMVRVANTGISGFVDSRGGFHGQTPLFEEAVRVHDVRLSTRRTVYDRSGDVVAWVALMALGAVVFRAAAFRKT